MSLKRLVPLNTVSLTANPSSAIAGDIYYNSTSSELRYYNGTNWIVLAGSVNALVDAKSIYQDVRNQSGSSFSIATPVYISGSEGSSGKMLISAASNASEATSSKTMGLTTSAISNNSNGQVISEGLLEGIDTTGAADGDPVWLGVNGAKIYGLANKPSAPAHLVFLGIVIRGGSATTGSIYVKIQNGFELQEIHNVEISSLINGNILAYDSTTQTWKNTNTLQSTSSTTPLVVKGTSSPSANIFEVQNSSGYPMVFVDAYGALKAQASGMYVNSGYASGTGLVVRGYASQTADLQQWQNSAGTVLARVDADGAFYAGGISAYTNGNVSIGNTLSASYMQTVYTMNIATYASGPASQVPLTINGVSGQTGNLTEWKSDVGTVLARISNLGGLYVNSNISQSSSGRTFLGGTADHNAFLNVSIPTASRQGIVVRANASQTANLQEWQSSAGGVLSYISPAGSIFASNSGTRLSGVGGDLVVIPTSATVVPIVARGYASQTADLQQWQNSAGTSVLKVGADGSVRGNGTFGAWGGAYSQFDTNGNPTFKYLMGYNVTAGGYYTEPAEVKLSVKAANLQTADLQQWQDSAGTALAKVDVSGNITAPSVNLTIPTSSATPAIVAKGESTYGTNIAEFRDTGNNLGTRINGYGSLITSVLAVGPNPSSFVGFSSTTASIKTLGANFPGLIIQGSTSQTADLQQWQDSSSTVLASINANGNLRGFAGLYGTNSAGTANYPLFVTNSVASTTVAVIKGATSQTASLQEWQDSAGTTLANISSTGRINSPQFGSVQSGKTYVNTGTSADNNSWTFVTNSASNKGIVIVGSSSQTANLQEWQNSAGTVLATVNASGEVRAPLFGSTSTGKALLYTAASATGEFRIDTNVATNKGLVIRGSGFQTANLQEWQNSSGTVLSKLDNSGFFYAPRTYTSILLEGGVGASTGNYVNINPSATKSGAIQVVSRSATNIGFIIQGAASQSANLTEWQDSTGTVLSYVDASGSFTVPSLTVSGDFTVNGTTTNINTTNLVVEDKNITIADVSTPTDTTADGAGITIKGATDKTFNWVNSTKSFTSSEPLVINTNSTTTSNLILKAITSQTGNLTEWQNSSGSMVAKLYPYNTDSDYILYLNGSGNGAGSYSSLVIGGRWIRNEQRTSQSKFGVNTGEWHMASNPDTSAIAITDNQVGVFGNTTNLTTFTVRSAASQTANLQEWQNSVGTVLSNIDSTGRFVSTIGYYTSGKISIGGASWSGGASMLNVWSTSTSNPTSTIRAVASQTANLQEWQNSSGTVLSAIDASGSFTSVSQPIQVAGSTYGFNKVVTADLGATSYWKIATLPSSTLGTYDQINIDAMLGGWASTGKTRYEIMLGNRDAFAYKYTKFGDGLTQARIQSYVEADGSVSVYLYSEDTFTTLSYNITLSTAGVANGATIYKNPTASTTAPTGTKVFDTGDTATYIPLINMNNAGLLSAKNASFTSTSTSAVTLTVKAAASQTANIQEWKNNAGTTAYLNTNLQYYNPGRISVLDTNFSAILSIFSGNPAATVSIFRGAASQTADLAQWQNSSGTTYLNITNAGAMISNGGVTIASNPTINAYGAAMKIASGVNSYPMLILQGAVSQTANLQEWQNSGATVIASIDSYGNAGFGGVGANSNQGLYVKTNSNPAVVGIIVQGASSQTADLQQWKNSAGTILTRIGSDGAIYRGATTIDSYGAIYTTETIAIGANGVQRFASGGMTIINRETASSIIFGVKGIASQTGDLTQWRNSSDTVLAKVDANGNFSAISKSFDIPHPIKENMRLRYASLEGNEHGVYVRGITKDKIIELPDYWLNLVNENSITVHLTPIGKPSKIYVKKIEGNKVYLGGRLKEAAYIIYAERKDIDKLVVEY